jgi:DNA repair exonuclease SbcCD nuclease subunit
LRILLFSDLHLHTWKYGSKVTPEGYNSRALYQFAVLNQIGNYAFDRGIQHVFFLGDLFHTHSQIPTQALSLAHNAFWWFKHKFNLETHFLVGNHDMVDKEGKIHSIGWLREYGTVIESQTTFHISGPVTMEKHGLFRDVKLTIHALPYTEDQETLNKFLADTPPGAIILMHQGIMGVPMGSGFVINEILSPELIPEQCKHAFTGHYHAHRKVNDKLTVVGSPTQLTWADVGDARGWVVYDTDTNTVEHVESSAPHFRVLDMEGGNYLPGGLPGHVTVESDFIRVVNWKGDRDELRSQLQSAGAAAVEFELDQILKPGHEEFKKASFSIEPILAEYDKLEMTDRRKTIGQLIRDQKYETSKI